MKVTRVFIHPSGWFEVIGLSCGKVIAATAPTIAEVSKQLMRKDYYFTRDAEIAEDINLVLQEQEEGLRDNPNKAQQAA